MLIKRLSVLEKINDIQEKFQNDSGSKPFNVSKWTASTAFSQEMINHFRMEANSSIIDYVYNYSFDEVVKSHLLGKLGLNDIHAMRAVISHNNTSSIMLLSVYLKIMQIKRVCILDPSYFSISHAMECLDIAFDIVPMDYTNSSHSIPIEQILTKYDAVWITSPVFCTGEYFGKNELEKIQVLLDNKIIVLSDESFCINGYEILRSIQTNKNFFGIYSPHKSIAFNGLKFSTIVCHESQYKFFDHWVDVVTGNLVASSQNAISHFLSSNYDDCKFAFLTYMDNAKKQTMKMLYSYPNLEYYSAAIGNLITLYPRNVPYSESENIQFIQDVIYTTGASFYPGSLSGFNEKHGFCFRLNLCLVEKDFFTALQSLLTYFQSIN